MENSKEKNTKELVDKIFEEKELTNDNPEKVLYFKYGLKIPLEEIGFRDRVIKPLKKEGYNTVEDLLNAPSGTWHSFDQFGMASVFEIEDVIKRFKDLSK